MDPMPTTRRWLTLAPTLLLMAGCAEIQAPPHAPPHPQAVPSGIRDATPPGGHAEESLACTDVVADVREQEEHTLVRDLIQRGHPDRALRFMRLYERYRRVRIPDLWEALRVRAMLALGCPKDAEALAKTGEGTEVHRWKALFGKAAAHWIVRGFAKE